MTNIGLPETLLAPRNPKPHLHTMATSTYISVQQGNQPKVIVDFRPNSLQNTPFGKLVIEHADNLQKALNDLAGVQPAAAVDTAPDAPEVDPAAPANPENPVAPAEPAAPATPEAPADPNLPVNPPAPVPPAAPEIPLAPNSATTEPVAQPPAQTEVQENADGGSNDQNADGGSDDQSGSEEQPETLQE